MCDILAQSNYPHDQEQRGLFDPGKLSVVPGSKKAIEIEKEQKAGTEPSAERKIEFAKHYLFYTLMKLKLPLDGLPGHDEGRRERLVFDFLASPPVPGAQA